MINAPHQIEENGNDKFDSLVESFRVGKNVPAIVAFESQAICGSHRIAAFNEAVDLWNNCANGWENSEQPELEIIELSNEVVEAACEHAGIDSLFDESDYNQICEWVLAVTSDEDITKALEDQ